MAPEPLPPDDDTDPYAEDPEAKAEVLADILAGLLGDKALQLVPETKGKGKKSLSDRGLPLGAPTLPTPELAPPTVYLVRHGKTPLNSPDQQGDRIRAWLDVPLDHEGIEEARRTAETLQGKFDALVTSDLQRARTTAELIAATSRLPIHETTPLLRPWNVGIYQGQLSSKVHPVLEHMAREKPQEALPEGESFEQFKGRVLPYLTGCMVSAQDGPLVVVTHFRCVKLAEAWVGAGCDPGGRINLDDFFQVDAPTGSVTRLVNRGQGWQVERDVYEPEWGASSDKSEDRKGS